MWPYAVECPNCKMTVCRIDLVDKHQINTFSFECGECHYLVKYAKPNAKVVAIRQTDTKQARLPAK